MANGPQKFRMIWVEGSQWALEAGFASPFHRRRPREKRPTSSLVEMRVWNDAEQAVKMHGSIFLAICSVPESTLTFARPDQAGSPPGGTCGGFPGRAFHRPSWNPPSQDHLHPPRQWRTRPRHPIHLLHRYFQWHPRHSRHLLGSSVERPHL